MVNGVINEFKKLYHSRIQQLLLCVIVILPMLAGYIIFDSGSTFNVNGSQVTAVRDGGKVLHGLDAIRKEAEIYHEYRGEMNDAWWNNIQKEIDKYSSLNTIESDKNEFPLYATRLKVLFEADILYQLMGNQPWNLTSSEKTEAMLAENPLDTPTGIKDNMNAIPSFNFGNYKGWNYLLDTLSVMALLYGIYITYLISNMFNKEKACNIDELLRTTKIGRKELTIYKVYATLIAAVIIPLFAIAIYTLITQLLFGLGDGSVTLMVKQGISPFTYFDSFVYGTGIIILGMVTLASIALFVSSIWKSSYISLGISLTLLLLPIFFKVDFNGFNIMALFPINYLMLANVFFYSPFVILTNTCYLYKDIALYFSLPTGTLFLLLSVWRNRCYQ